MRDAWALSGRGSVAVRGLRRPRVTDAGGECPVLYYDAALPEQEVEYLHGWAFCQLFRLRYGDAAWLRACADYAALHAAVEPFGVREDAAD